MDAKTILDKIDEDAKASAAGILEDARKKADALREASRARIDALIDANDRRILTDAQEQETRQIRMAELEEKKRYLAAKRNVLERAFEQAVALLRDLPEDEARAFFLKRVVALADGDETLLPGADGPQLFDASFIKEANAALEKAGKKGSLVLGQEKAAGSGFVLQKGGIEINCTFESLVDALRLEAEADIAGILFP